MRPDYCPLWNEPCQKGCDPKCGTMNAWEALRKKNERLRDALETVRAWDIGRAMDDMTLIGAKVNFRIPERIRSKIQSALQGDKP